MTTTPATPLTEAQALEIAAAFERMPRQKQLEWFNKAMWHVAKAKMNLAQATEVQLFETVYGATDKTGAYRVTVSAAGEYKCSCNIFADDAACHHCEAVKSEREAGSRSTS